MSKSVGNEIKYICNECPDPCFLIVCKDADIHPIERCVIDGQRVKWEIVSKDVRE